MIKNTTYFEGGIPHDTYKFNIRNTVKILVKKEGKPFKVVSFDKLTGRIYKPTENE
jgi:hypothetical protein